VPDELAPENRSKALPRGKPFPKGVSGNPDAQFKPGQSGNPGGRPSTALFTEALKRVCGMAVKRIGVKPTDKVSLAIVKVWAQRALNGDVRAAIEMANRVDGPPAQTLQHQGLENFYQAEPGEPRQKEILGHVVEILLERSRMYGLPVPEIVREAEAEIDAEEQKAEEENTGTE